MTKGPQDGGKLTYLESDVPSNTTSPKDTLAEDNQQPELNMEESRWKGLTVQLWRSKCYK